MLKEVLSIVVGNSEFLSYPLSGYWLLVLNEMGEVRGYFDIWVFGIIY